VRLVVGVVSGAATYAVLVVLLRVDEAREVVARFSRR
jgi:hypothetical protein